MVQLPHVQEHQEEAVWLVLEDRCQELIVEDHTELASSAFVAPRVQTQLKWWATRSVGGNNTDTIFQHSPGSRVVSWLSPRLLVLLNVCSQSPVKWTEPVENLCLRTP